MSCDLSTGYILVEAAEIPVNLCLLSGPLPAGSLMLILYDLCGIVAIVSFLVVVLSILSPWHNSLSVLLPWHCDSMHSLFSILPPRGNSISLSKMTRLRLYVSLLLLTLGSPHPCFGVLASWLSLDPWVKFQYYFFELHAALPSATIASVFSVAASLSKFFCLNKCMPTFSLSTTSAAPSARGQRPVLLTSHWMISVPEPAALG